MQHCRAAQAGRHRDAQDRPHRHPRIQRDGLSRAVRCAVAGRLWQRLASAGGLTALGASRVVLEPGGWSSQRHWHSDEDELVVILSGEAVLIEDAGETVVRAGDVLAFAMGVPDGHHLINRSAKDCVMIAVGAGNFAGSGEYPDIDMTFAGEAYLHKDGTAY